jgi:hydroxymethylbilane synthase
MAKRGDPRDMLILPRMEKPCAGHPASVSPFTELPSPETFRASLSIDRSRPVGCSSARRRIQLNSLLPELGIAPIRGNVPTRLEKLDQGRYGALILAAAGIERLGIRDRPGYFFPIREMVPAAGQGVLAIQGRRSEDYAFLDALRDPLTEEAARTERQVIRALGGGCHFPAAAYAEIVGTEIKITAMFAPAGDTHAADSAPVFFIKEISGGRDRAPELAETLSRRLLSGGEDD